MIINNELVESIVNVLGISEDELAVELDDDMGMWGVWLDGDLIGAGQAKSEALVSALFQAREWSK